MQELASQHACGRLGLRAKRDSGWRREERGEVLSLPCAVQRARPRVRVPGPRPLRGRASLPAASASRLRSGVGV